MKKGSGAQGFTIVEVIIFLGVSSVLLVSALLLVGGQQKKTQFSQSIRDIQSKIDDVANNVDTGYYNNTGNFTCDAAGGAPHFSIGSSGQGTNAECIFIGKAMQFGVGGNNEAYNIYSIAGIRQKAGLSEEVETLSEAKPRAIHPDNGLPLASDPTERNKLQYGLEVRKMYYNPGKVNISTFAFISSFGKYSSNQLSSGSKTTNIAYIGAGSTNESTAITDISSMGDSNVNPSGGIVICFLSPDGENYGVITVGGTVSNGSSDLKILSKADATAAGGLCA